MIYASCLKYFRINKTLKPYLVELKAAGCLKYFRINKTLKRDNSARSLSVRFEILPN